MNEGPVVINVCPGRYFSTIWFVAGAEGDWLAAVWRDLPGGEWHVSWRFKTSKGERSHYEAKGKSGDASWEARTVEMTSAVAELHGTRLRGDVHTLRVGESDHDAIMKAILAEPWAHKIGFETVGGQSA